MKLFKITVLIILISSASILILGFVISGMIMLPLWALITIMSTGLSATILAIIMVYAPNQTNGNHKKSLSPRALTKKGRAHYDKLRYREQLRFNVGLLRGHGSIAVFGVKSDSLMHNLEFSLKMTNKFINKLNSMGADSRSMACQLRDWATEQAISTVESYISNNKFEEIFTLLPKSVKYLLLVWHIDGDDSSEPILRVCFINRKTENLCCYSTWGSSTPDVCQPWSDFPFNILLDDNGDLDYSGFIEGLLYNLPTITTIHGRKPFIPTKVLVDSPKKPQQV